MISTEGLEELLNIEHFGKRMTFVRQFHGMKLVFHVVTVTCLFFYLQQNRHAYEKPVKIYN